MKNPKRMGCQQVLLHPNKDLFSAILEYACGEANKIYNCATYYARQVFFKEHRYVGKGELCRQLKWNRHFGAIYVSAAQQICNCVVEAFNSFQALLQLFRQGELLIKPQPPKYRKPGLFTLSYPKRWLKLTNSSIRCPLGKKVKTWFGIDAFYIPMPSNLDWAFIHARETPPSVKCDMKAFYGVGRDSAPLF